MSAQTPIEIRRRLKRRAAELGLDFQQAVLYYAMERFLFRLSQTRWSDRLVVKANVLLVEPFDSIVFERTVLDEGLRYVAPSQIAADLLTSSGRGPEEAEALIEWMLSHEEAWRV